MVGWLVGWLVGWFISINPFHFYNTLINSKYAIENILENLE
ncbi:hypothetical protein BV134_1593 [Haemophilus influenzae]|nr:hypothetical protein BV131_1535 [Haemophilus influenzae]AVJ05617.1 hypothetical protein BV134_1593 [Haemophilus influenzae]